MPCYMTIASCRSLGVIALYAALAALFDVQLFTCLGLSTVTAQQILMLSHVCGQHGIRSQ
jgi:hypothetical protein